MSFGPSNLHQIGDACDVDRKRSADFYLPYGTWAKYSLIVFREGGGVVTCFCFDPPIMLGLIKAFLLVMYYVFVCFNKTL